MRRVNKLMRHGETISSLPQRVRVHGYLPFNPVRECECCCGIDHNRTDMQRQPFYSHRFQRGRASDQRQLHRLEMSGDCSNREPYWSGRQRPNNGRNFPIRVLVVPAAIRASQIHMRIAEIYQRICAPLLPSVDDSSCVHMCAAPVSMPDARTSHRGDLLLPLLPKAFCGTVGITMCRRDAR